MLVDLHLESLHAVHSNTYLNVSLRYVNQKNIPQRFITFTRDFCAPVARTTINFDVIIIITPNKNTVNQET